MSEKLPVSLIIPVFNMGAHALELWELLHQHGITSLVQEILIVDDGSTDETLVHLNSIKGNIRIISYPENQGRFKARLTGARNATQPHLLFIDARNRIPHDFSNQLRFIQGRYDNVIGDILIDAKESVYSLYWKLSHDTIFQGHYSRLRRGPITLTVENYDEFLKGTTLLYCRRDLFLNACDSLSRLKVESDDTLLLKEFVRTSPLVIDSRFHCYWSPRQTLKGFLERVWERGPSFVEYHIFEHRGRFFYVTMFLMAYFFVMMSFLFISFSFFLSFFFTTVALVAFTSLFFTRNPVSFIKIAPLHTVTVMTFFLSVLKAIAKSFFKAAD